MIQNRVGTVATGDDFFDRKVDLARFWRHVETENLLLLAPRRVGKTSVMMRMRDDAELNGFTAAYVSVASAPDEAAFVRRIIEQVATLPHGHRALGGLLQDRWKALLRLVRRTSGPGFSIELTEKGAARWTELGDGLARALDGADGRWLLLIDELPVFVLRLLSSDPARGRAFLTWLREIRLSPEASLSVRWLLAGSIGLDTVVARARIGETINDLRLVHLGPFEPDVADALLRALGASCDLCLDDDVCAHVRRRVGWLIPYHLQLVFSELRDLLPPGSTPTRADVDRTFDVLLSPSRGSYFDWWRQRLVDELGVADSRLALGILAVCARDPDGARAEAISAALTRHVPDPARRDEAQRDLVRVLETDGYLGERGGRHHFLSPLLREHWVSRVLA